MKIVQDKRDEMMNNGTKETAMHAANSTKGKKRGIKATVSSVLVAALAVVVALAGGTAALALSGATYSSSLTEFAAPVGIADITIDPSVFSSAADVTEVTGDFTTYYSQVRWDLGTNQTTGTTYSPTNGSAITYTYKNAATLSDRTTADVIVTVKDFHITTSTDPNRIYNGIYRIFNGPSTEGGGSLEFNSINYSGSSNSGVVYGIDGTITVTVVDSSGNPVNGDLIFTGFGVNLIRSASNVAYNTLPDFAATHNWSEQVEFSSATSNVYIPQGRNRLTYDDSGSGVVVYPSTTGSGADANLTYESGYATSLSNGTAVTFRSSAQTGSNGTNYFFKPGALSHTHDFWSSPGGTIQTTKGTDSDHANADGSLSDSTVLNPGIYSVADGKDVTYTLTPEPGYRIRKLEVDGTATTPTTQVADEGTGKLQYYTLDITDDNDHEIFVEWEPIPASVNATKEWDDESNKYNNRPDSLAMELSPSGILPTTQTITNTTSTDSQNIPGWGNNTAWSEGSDTVIQEPTTTGWRGAGGTTTIFYSNVDYKWYNYSYDATTKTYTKGSAITDTVDFLPKYDSSWELIDYQVTENGGNALPGYTTTTSTAHSKTAESDDALPTAAYKYTFTNTLKYIDFTLTKKWEGDDDSTRPSTDNFKQYVKILKDGTISTDFDSSTNPQVTDNGDDTYTVVWTLPEYVDEAQVTYTAQEPTAPPGYQADNTDPVSTGETITNKARKDVSITKVWDDSNDTYTNRPDANVTSVTSMFKLYDEDPDGTGSEVTVADSNIDVVDNGDGTWTITWKELPSANTSGDITYYVKETGKPDGYSISGVDTVVAKDTTAQGSPNTITNKLDTIDYTFTKKWNDGGVTGDRVTPVSTYAGNNVTLYQNNGTSDTDVSTTFSRVRADNSDGANTYTITWTGLPTYVNKAAVTYHADETTAVPGYSASTTTGTNSTTVTNTKVKDIEITKVWDDDSNTHKNRPDADATEGNYDLYKGDPNNGGTKVEKDASGTAISATVTRDGDAGDDTVKFSNLPAYDDQGAPITYYVKEASVPDGYETTSDSAKEDGTITNKETTVYVKVNKTWNDDGYEGIADYARKNVTINLTAGSVSALEDVKLIKTTDTNQYAEFTDLPTHYKKTAVSYGYSETAIDGWNKSEGALETKYDENDSTKIVGYEAIVTNTPAPGEEVNQVSLTINKVDGASGNAGPLSGAEFTVYTDATGTTEATAATDVTANMATSGANGEATFTFLKDGTYYIKETKAPTGYKLGTDVYTVVVNKDLSKIELKTSLWTKIYNLLVGGTGITGDVTSGYEMTVENTPLKADLNVVKVWDDNDNQDGKRDNFTIVVEKSTDGGTNWNTYTTINGTAAATSGATVKSLEDLPAYEDGNPVFYRINETTIPADYEANYALGTSPAAADYDSTSSNITTNLMNSANDAAETKTLTVKNTHTPETIDITVQKQWNDENLRALNKGYSRDNIEFILSGTAGSSPVDLDTSDDTKTTLSGTITKADSDDAATGALVSTTFTGLPRYTNGNEIAYTVTETVPAGWTATPASRTMSTSGDFTPVYDTSDPTKLTGYTTTIKNTPDTKDAYNSVKLNIQKTDKNTDAVITATNATFGVYTDSGCTSPATAGSDDTNQVTSNSVDTASGVAAIEFKQPGTYYIKETSAPAGYALNNTVYTVVVAKDEDSLVITKKGSAPDTFWEMLYNLIFGDSTKTQFSGDDTTGWTLSVPDEPLTANVLVKKAWEDANDQDGLRKKAADADALPQVTLQWTTATSPTDSDFTDMPTTGTGYNVAEAVQVPDANGDVLADSTVRYTWQNLPAYVNGLKVTYRVKESDVDGGTLLSGGDYTKDTGDTFSLVDNSGAAKDATDIVVTNTHTPKTINIQVNKVWEDETDANRKSAALTLYKITSTGTTKLNAYTGTVETTSGTNVVTWSDLPAYENGEAITYRVEEASVAGYTTEYAISYNDTDGNTQQTADTAEVPAESVSTGTTAVVTITNIELTDITVKKIWKSGANANVTVELYRKAKTSGMSDDVDFTTTTGAVSGDTLTTWTPDSTWEKVEGSERVFTSNSFTYDDTTGDDETVTYTGLPKYDDDNNIYIYRVYETTDGGTIFEKDYTDNLTVTNTNVYTAAGTVHINVVKELKGRNWKSDDKFYFKIEAVKVTSDKEGNNEVTTITVPLPQDTAGTEKPIGSASTSTNAVGAIGHAVDFEPILFESTAATEGQTLYYHYKIYETDEAGNIKLAGTTKNGITYEKYNNTGEHTLIVKAVDDGAGNITATPYWDGADQTGPVPVFVNTYDGVATVHSYIVKHIADRNYASGDNFKFKVLNLSGSMVRENVDDDGTTEPQTAKDAATISKSDGSYVTASGSNHTISTGSSGNVKAAKSNTYTIIKASDFALPSSGVAKGTYIYELYEDEGSSAANDDLSFDAHRIYMRVDVEDNQDGTLSVETGYYYDAACTEPAPTARVLINKNTGAIEGTAEDDDHIYVNAAYFENTQSIDIPVTKTWVKDDGNGNLVPTAATDNVTVALWRYAVDDPSDLSSVPTSYDDWTPVDTHLFQIGDIDETTGSSDPYTFEDQPLLERDANGNLTGKYYVYRVRESTRSGSYETTYSLTENNTEGSFKSETAEDMLTAEGSSYTVRNKIKATNTANIAAVKQLMGRQWLDSDDFSFTLEPVGKGTYGTDGKYNGQTATYDIPMPKTDTDRYSTTAGTGTEDAKATTHAYEGNTKVDPNGSIERLARFGEITYTLSDLTYDSNSGHMQGDFFYIMKEAVPSDAKNSAGKTYADAVADGDDLKGVKFESTDGISYDATPHTVHVRVRENNTDELIVQIAYDETTVGDVSTGTQFTPVYTNRYMAKGTTQPSIEKRILGRNFKAGETFSFTIAPLGGAPFADENGTEYSGGTISATITAGGDLTKPQVLQVNEKLGFTLDDLVWTVGEEGALDARDNSTDEKVYLDADGTQTATAGMKYGRFMYGVRETGASDTALDIDDGTEYVRVTVVDKGDGTLAVWHKIYADRYGIERRKDSDDSSKDAVNVTFVNETTRDLTVNKVWTDAPTGNAVFKLQWTTDTPGTSATWHEVSEASWLNTVPDIQTITKEQYNNGTRSVKWTSLPAFADTDGDNDLTDKWIYYRVVEESIPYTDTRYKTSEIAATAKATDDGLSSDPVNTEAQNAEESAKVTAIWVGNFPAELSGTAAPHVVKQLIGRGWTGSDSFTFSIVPTGGTLGDGTTVDAKDVPMPAGSSYDATENKWSGNTAAATMSNTPVTVGEYNVAFANITIKSTDLKVDTSDGIAKGDFTYTIAEVVPDGAKEVSVGGKKYYIKDNIKYTGDTHTVTIHAENKGDGKITTQMTYDNRPVGDFVPVYTNEALVGTPISGTKTWVGGEDAEHLNAASGADALGIKLQRKIVSDSDFTALTKDDLGRTLKVVWSADTGDATFTVKAINPDQSDTSAADYLLDPVLDTVDDDGNEYEYRIIEGSVPSGYNASYATQTITNDKITNTSVTTAKITVTKTWDDSEDSEGLRPEKVVMHLYKEVNSGSETVQVEVAKKEIAKGSEATGATWSDLPVYDDEGNEITYVVIEESEYGYTTTYTTKASPTDSDYTDSDNKVTLGTGDKTVKVKNSLTPATNKVTVTKVWDDGSNVDGKRPASIEIKLYKKEWNKTSGAYGDEQEAGSVTLDGEADADQTANNKEIAKTDDNTWNAEFDNLKSTVNGKTVIYYVKETTDVSTAGYTTCVSGDQAGGFTVTNKRTPDSKITITYKDGNDMLVERTINRGDDEPAAPADPTKDGYTFGGWVRTTDSSGNVTYTAKWIKDDNSICVYKVWNDNNDQEGKRPDSVTVSLKANGSAAKDLSGNDVGNVTLSEDNNWSHKFENMPIVDDDGNKITYKVEEKSVPDGYTASVTGSGTGADPFVITNTHGVETTSVKAKKVWAGDDNDKYGLRTDVILHLYGKDTDGLVVYDGGTKTIAKGSTDSVEWTNLPKYHYSNAALTWEVVEEAVPGYVTSVSGSAANGFTVTNTYEGPVTEVSVEKKWDDHDNLEGKRPGSVTFELWKKVGDATDEKVDTQTVTLGTNGEASYKWKDLPVTEEKITRTETKETAERSVKYVNTADPTEEIDETSYSDLPDTGKVNYKAVTEDVITGYVSKTDSSDIKTAEEYEALDDAGKAAYDPVTDQEIKYVNTADDSDVITADVYDGLPEVAKGNYEAVESVTTDTKTVDVTEEVAVIYYVKEQPVDGYEEPVVTSTGAGTYNVINRRDYVIPKTSVKVVKAWADDDDKAGKRPAYVDFILKANGEQVGTAKLTAAEGWTYTFKDLDKTNSDGNTITYTVEEKKVEGYTASSVSGDGSEANPFSVTNTYNAKEPLTLKATKVWKDADGNDLGSQQHAVELRLIRVIDGAEKDMGDDKAKTIKAGASGDDLTVTWEDLEAEVEGKSATYTVREKAVDGYKVSMSDGEVKDNIISITVTNTKEPEPETPEPEKITITYKDSDEFGNEVYKTATIEKGGKEPDAPADPSHEGYTFTGWKRTTNADGSVTYVATYAEIPVVPTPVEVTKFKVTYLDPKAADTKMILKASLFDDQSGADAEASGMSGKPNDPAHEGYVFAGWVANQDEFGDWIIVAKYNEVIPEQPRTPVVSFIDPQSGQPVLVSKESDDPLSVDAPADPKHSNLQFVGWVVTKDAAGNTIYVAKYACDCSNGGSGNDENKDNDNISDDTSGHRGREIVHIDKAGRKVVKTGDTNIPLLWIFILGLALAAATVTAVMMNRNRRNR